MYHANKYPCPALPCPDLEEEVVAQPHLALTSDSHSTLTTTTWPSIWQTAMNSLTYLSRQFDVLASARTPPSTPTTGSPSFFSNQFPSRPHSQQDQDPSSGTSIKRVKTWSTKSFLFPHSHNSSSSLPKRSFSSPTDFISFASVRPSLESSSPPTSLSSKNTVKGVIRRVFFIRLFVLVCHLLCAAWSSVTTRSINPTLHERPVESGIDMDSKDTEPEIKQTAPLCPPSPSSLSSYFFRIHRPIEDQPSIVSPKQEPEPPLLPPSTMSGGQLPSEA